MASYSDSQTDQRIKNTVLSEIKPPDSKVLIIMTGGTICMRESEQGLVPARGFLDACLLRRPSFDDGSHPPSVETRLEDYSVVSTRCLRTPISSYGKHVLYTVLEFEELLDSSSIDSYGWTRIAQAIFQNYQLFDGFVVLHGTDSLAYTSSALSFILQNLGKPVILTGSQVPMLELQSDATDNLLGSLIIAGHFMIPEVCLFFNYKLFRGNRATKVSANEFDAFASPNHPPLATITSVKTEVNWHLVFRSTAIHPFTIETKLEPSVACLRIFPGIRPDMVEGVFRLKGLRGLVLETFGAGNAPAGPDSALTRIIVDAVKRNIVVVNITQCFTGSVRPAYASGAELDRAGVVNGHDLTCEAALTKLAFLLAQEPETGNVIRKMAISLRGELNGQSETFFRHPAINRLQPRHEALSVIAYAVSQGKFDAVLEELRSHEEFLLDYPDYMGNTPLHLAAMSSNIEILRFFLSQGASVHLRNNQDRTALFLAANAGLHDNVVLLRKSGAHLHSNELAMAKMKAKDQTAIWIAAGLSPVVCSVA